MTRQSPAVGRIVSILNFFVEHPQQAFTLTQIVKSLRLSRATCHALLVGLVEAGYLYRRPDKSYVLGPALISLAVNAQQHFSPLAVARQEMRMLADELRDKLKSGVVALGAVTDDGKVALLVVVTKDLTAKIKAGDLIKPLAAEVGGTGGGRPEMAQAGGKDPSRLDASLEKVFGLVEHALQR